MRQLSSTSGRDARDQPGSEMRGRARPRKVARRRALAVLIGCVALLASVQVATAAAATIEGTISHSGTGVEGIEVRVLDASTRAFAGSTQTGSGGKYKVESLPAGSYKVQFLDFTFPKKYDTLYYKEALTFASAETLVLSVAETKTGIDAKMKELGTISGTVRDSHGNPLSRISVFASVTPSGEQEEFSEANAETNASGEYTLPALGRGLYTVDFFPQFGENWIGQFFNQASSSNAAFKVEVKDETPTTGIDAALQPGGAISGTVTDSATHQPLKNVFISAFDPSKAEGFGTSGFAGTNTNGEYTITGLASGSFVLEFEQFVEPGPGSDYINLKDSGVGVTQGSTTSHNVSLVPKKPSNTTLPAVSGPPAVGQTLSCSNGSWTGIATISYAYKWLRDGGTIAGPSGNTYVLQAADQGHGVACEVTASNPSGHATATSNTLKVPAALVLPPAPTLTSASLTHKKFRVAKKATAISAKKAPLGTIFRFTLSTPSKLQIAITHTVPGLRRGHSCVAPSAKLRHKHAKHCNRTLKVGTLTRAIEPKGIDSIAFSGRIGQHPLKPGPYKALLSASNAGGHSAPVTLSFIVVR